MALCIQEMSKCNKEIARTSALHEKTQNGHKNRNIKNKNPYIKIRLVR